MRRLLCSLLTRHRLFAQYGPGASYGSWRRVGSGCACGARWVRWEEARRA